MNVFDLIDTLKRLTQEKGCIEDYEVYFVDMTDYTICSVTDVTVDHITHQCVLQQKV